MTRGTSAGQLGFDWSGTGWTDAPTLRETTFVVVDLETTGARPGEDAITEIGAVKVRGGEVLGEMSTLVDPGRSVPPRIVELTGITTAMLVDAPRIQRVLPSFLEFARGSVLVAHNARFDVGFLRAAAAAMDIAWPKFTVLCTVRLARRVLTREEAPSAKLSSLALHFGVSTRPTHRALDDARATVEVLHHLIERVGNQGVHSVAELLDYMPAVPAAHRAKRTLAAGLPQRPGVYLFRGPGGEVLYVGTSANLHRRVRSYFTGSETRGRMKEMVALAESVDHVECAHVLEAGVRELRLIVAHLPPYNRRSKFPRKGWWITLTDEAFPRLSIVRTPTPRSLGPFGERSTAAEVADMLARTLEIRTCTGRLARLRTHACEVTTVGGCPAATDQPQTAAEYAAAPARFLEFVTGADDAVVRRLICRIDALGRAELFDTAARMRDRTAALITVTHRMHNLAALARVEQMVAARRSPSGGWDFVVIRSGRLASAGSCARGVPPMPVVDALVAAAETVVPDESVLRGASPDETGLLMRWLGSDGVRIVSCSDPYHLPVGGTGRWTGWAETVQSISRAHRSSGR